MTNTIKLTWELRYELTDALVEAKESGLYGDHDYYLGVLQHTAPDSLIKEGTDIYDALQYFGFSIVD